jgi:hypothetical protein
LPRDEQREVERDLPAEGVADDVQVVGRLGCLGGQPGGQGALRVSDADGRGDGRV